MSKIQWTDATWSPTRGCSRVSDGCTNCYAMGQARRFDHRGTFPEDDGPYAGLTTVRRGKVDWSGVVRFVPEMLDRPLRWRKPRRVFVASMSDLFHESLSHSDTDQVFAVMALASQHTFQVLTKRADRMRRYFETDPSEPLSECTEARVGRIAQKMARERGENVDAPNWDMFWTWPLPNVWLGVSAEDQQRADERIPDLLACPAAIRFVSVEPMLGPVDLDLPRCDTCGQASDCVGDDGATPFCNEHECECSYGHWLDSLNGGLDWVIVGGESGPGARLFDLAHGRSIVEQCRAAGVPVFFKQCGSNALDTDNSGLLALRFKHRKGGDPAEWPEDLRVREFPEASR